MIETYETSESQRQQFVANDIITRIEKAADTSSHVYVQHRHFASSAESEVPKIQEKENIQFIKMKVSDTNNVFGFLIRRKSPDMSW